MDDSDVEGFAAALLHRARLRKQNLNLSPSPPRKSPSSEPSLDQENIDYDDLRDDEEEQEPLSSLTTPAPAGRRRTLRRLAELYGQDAEETQESPVHKHSSLEKTPEVGNAGGFMVEGMMASGRRARLGALAQKFNEQEDEIPLKPPPVKLTPVNKGISPGRRLSKPMIDVGYDTSVRQVQVPVPVPVPPPEVKKGVGVGMGKVAKLIAQDFGPVGHSKRRESTANFQGIVSERRKLFESGPGQKQDRARSNSPPKKRTSRRSTSTPRGESPKSTQSPIQKPLTPKKRSISPPKNTPNYPGLAELKKVRVSLPKPGKIYPSLTDAEATGTESEDCFGDDDFEVLESSVESERSLGGVIHGIAVGHNTEELDASTACRVIDEFIDDALEGQDYTLMDTESPGQTPQKFNMEHGQHTSTPVIVGVSPHRKSGGESIMRGHENQLNERSEYMSHESSFTYSPVEKKPIGSPDKTQIMECSDLMNAAYKNASEIGAKLISSPERIVNFSNSPEKEGKHTPLLHTVSFYRKLQAATPTTTTPKKLPIPKVLDAVEESGDDGEGDTGNQEDVIATIYKMEEEISIHQKSIAQASKALNLCKSTIEFIDSAENVECEKILLISSQRRLALLNAIHRLRTDQALKTVQVQPTAKGTLNISKIQLKMKRQNQIDPNRVFNIIALIKHNSTVLATQLVQIKVGQTEVKFDNDFILTDLEPGFTINVEVWGLESRGEILPHEAKYHIYSNKKGTPISKLTPKKSAIPKKGSPAGPSAIRSTNFQSYGTLNLNITNLRKGIWTLTNCQLTPIEGEIGMSLRCSPNSSWEQEGFLTLFEDLGGFGAWVRRWCWLKGGVISCWMYPGDTNEIPLCTIHLKSVPTPRIGPAPREVCARANTLLLITTRPKSPNDKDSLTTSVHGSVTSTKHLISADTKEERDEWIEGINKVIGELREWSY